VVALCYYERGKIMRQFKFGKSYEELDIAGEIYKLDLDDEKIKQNQVEIEKFYNEANKISNIDTDGATTAEQHEVFDKTKSLIKSLLDQLLGEGSFDKLYDQSGGSLMNLIDLIYELADIIKEQSDKRFEDKKNKYIKTKES